VTELSLFFPASWITSTPKVKELELPFLASGMQNLIFERLIFVGYKKMFISQSNQKIFGSAIYCLF